MEKEQFFEEDIERTNETKNDNIIINNDDNSIPKIQNKENFQEIINNQTFEFNNIENIVDDKDNKENNISITKIKEEISVENKEELIGIKDENNGINTTCTTTTTTNNIISNNNNNNNIKNCVIKEEINSKLKSDNPTEFKEPKIDDNVKKNIGKKDNVTENNRNFSEQKINNNKNIEENLEAKPSEKEENKKKEKEEISSETFTKQNNKKTINITDIKKSLREYYTKISSFVFKFKNNNPRLFNILIISLFIVLLFPKLLLLLIVLIAGFIMGLMYIVPTRDMESFNSIKANSLTELQRNQKINDRITKIQQKKEKIVIVNNNEFTPEMRLALDNFLDDFVKNYIDKWWVKLNHSNNTEFTDDIKIVLNKAFSKINLYSRNVSITSLIIPIFNHLIEQMQLYREYEEAGLPPNVYIKRFSNSKLTKYTSKESEMKILRDLGSIIANQVLEPKEKECHAVFSFIQEIMATTVLLPVVEKLSDPYFFNNLIYTKLGDNSKPKKKAQKLSVLQDNNLNKKSSQVSLDSSMSFDNNSQSNFSINQNSSAEVSYDKYNDSTVGQFDQRNDVSLILNDTNMNRMSFEEGIKDRKTFSDFNIYLKSHNLDVLLYLYIKIEQFKECFSNEEFDLDTIENYGNNIISNFIFNNPNVLLENLIHPAIVEKYYIRIDNSVLRGNLFDELQKEVSLTINQKFWPIFMKNYYQSNDDSSTLDSDHNESGQELEDEFIVVDPYALPPNVKNFEEYSFDDIMISSKNDNALSSFINRIPPLRQKTLVTNRYNLYKHRRCLSEGDIITIKTFGTDYINKMKNIYGEKYIIKDHKRIDRHLDHIILLTQNKIKQYGEDIVTKRKEVLALDQTIEHVMDNFNRSENKDEELFQITMKNITGRKMEYQMEIEELNQVRTSLENKIVELKKHQIYRAKYKIIIIDPLQDSFIINNKNIPDNYQFQLEVYNIVNTNEKYEMTKTYKEFYNFHRLLKLKYKSIPDFPTYEYIIYKKKFFRNHLISRKALPFEQRESVFIDIYKVRMSELVQELENYINILSNIPTIGENPDFIKFIIKTIQIPSVPLRGPSSASIVNQRLQPEIENDRRRRRSFNDKKSLSSVMNFIKPTKGSNRREKSSSFSFSRLNEKINEKISDKINDKFFSPNSTGSTSSRLRKLAPNLNRTSSNVSDRAPLPNGSIRNHFGNRYDSLTSNGSRTTSVSSMSMISNDSNASSRNPSSTDLLTKRNEQVEIFEVQSEADSIKNSKSNEDPVNINMSQEAIDMILECIICLVEEIFQLNNPDQWMRQKAFQVVKQVALKSFSSKINNILCAFLGKVFSEESFTKYVNSLTKNLFHKYEDEESNEEDGKLSPDQDQNEISKKKKKKKKKEISYEEKEKVKYHAKKLLLTSNKIPLHYISKVVGTNNTQNGMIRLFNMFQVPEFNRHLMCVVLQSVVICVFDNDDIEML